jgi:F-type H+-transporting ATPase subunit 8
MYLNIKKKMPQLVPFYFINEVTFTFAILVVTIYMLSKYILPRFVRLFLSRTYLSKLSGTSK